MRPDMVAGEAEVAMGVVGVQTVAAGLMSQELLLLLQMAQGHSQLCLTGAIRHPRFLCGPRLLRFCLLKDPKGLRN